MKTAERPQTEINPFVEIFNAQKVKAQELRAGSIKERKQKLKMIKEWVAVNTDKIISALFLDFKKPEVEVLLSEIQPVAAAAKHAIHNIHRWSKPKRVPTPLPLVGASSHIHFESKGVCLIIAPWNYPFNLMILPLIEAIAAGNTAILKPSEMTPHTAQLIEDMITELFNENEVKVIQGEINTSQQLLGLPFDHIFFTGSPAVGKIVMAAAAKNLTSVTLELGGKSPVIIDETADLKDTAEKLVWGKFMNCGQTCIAPDYAYVHSSIYADFESALKIAIDKVYYRNGQVNTDDYARIVNEKHYQRVSGLLEDVVEVGGKISFGGTANAKENLIEPTIVTNLPDSCRVMQEEIFGPILPLLTYETIEDVIVQISKKPKPLALYYFSKSKRKIRKVIKEIPAGGVCVNESVLHFTNHDLPFGGVNNSGIGKSHGYYGFLAFSNEKAVLKQRIGLTSIKFFYPPYTSLISKLTRVVAKYL
jgi:aldehyde dehydrogenase (NAD+)